MAQMLFGNLYCSHRFVPDSQVYVVLVSPSRTLKIDDKYRFVAFARPRRALPGVFRGFEDLMNCVHYKSIHGSYVLSIPLHFIFPRFSTFNWSTYRLSCARPRAIARGLLGLSSFTMRVFSLSASTRIPFFRVTSLS